MISLKGHYYQQQPTIIIIIYFLLEKFMRLVYYIANIS